MGGNEQMAKAGAWLGSTGGGGPQLAGNVLERQGNTARAPAPIFAHENVLQRVSAPTGSKSALATAAWPSETYAGKDYRLFNSEPILALHEPAAHSDGDTIFVFQSSNVISAGDVFSTTSYPVIDRQRGGSINGAIAALNHLVDLCTPRHTQEGGTYVIPGHGRISDVADVVEYRDMVTVIRDRIQDLIRKGMSLDQVKAAKPTRDYDTRYGAPDMFVEAVYNSLKGAAR
jgi:glyoxylase-like metal-dependent hydrolase (beta-lactamase superfamily II)